MPKPYNVFKITAENEVHYENKVALYCAAMNMAIQTGMALDSVLTLSLREVIGYYEEKTKG